MPSGTRTRPTKQVPVKLDGRSVAQLTPEDLADKLDVWALRREKVLAKLDIRAAKQARALAARARGLSSTEVDPLGWLELRAEVARLLAEASHAA